MKGVLYLQRTNVTVSSCHFGYAPNCHQLLSPPLGAKLEQCVGLTDSSRCFCYSGACEHQGNDSGGFISQLFAPNSGNSEGADGSYSRFQGPCPQPSGPWSCAPSSESD
ncbi:hypothetical protein OJAV_G00144980 [Oryzias javanicus]|uniref:Uncharacterized protein n=1 Tax=Oryzias javanicus TaxID=123683 RepID=A0A3S2U728_ORYJA|nr:hypothetical protein OJAV_G00144980 [Oryzias javanicus]